MKTKHLLTLTLALLLLALAQAAAQERDPLQTFEALLKRFDTDLDGRISEAEFTRGKELFRRLDRDHDGFLTAADFAKPAGKPSAESAKPEREPTADELEFFEKKVRPVLANSCFECHSETSKKLKGGLHVDSRAGLVAGGTTGPALVPGDIEASLFVHAVRWTDPELQMPPKKRLADDVVKDLERWVSMGAPWPGAVAAVPRSAKAPIDLAKAREFWSFRPPVRTTAPSTKDSKWAWSDIDRFLLASMESMGIAPVADADKRTWMRRVSFDLTGLPPTPEELIAFETDRSPTGYETVVDRLLASSAYGERFGRHWLDVARYAESSGKDTNVVYPHAWRYRDWVIAAFNADKPYDQFLKEQLAGDLLPAGNDDQRAANMIATGYLALGAKGQNNRDKRQFALDVADEQIDTVSQGMLGMTMACARCHDHKFDPIPTEDYYALAGIFLSTDTRYGTHRGPGNNQPSELISLPQNAHVDNGPAMEPFVRNLFQRARDNFAKVAAEGEMQPRAKGEKGDKGEPAAKGEQGVKGGQAAKGELAGKGDKAAGDKKRPDNVDAQKARVANEEVALLDDLLSRFDSSGRANEKNRLAMGAVEGQTRDIAVLDRGELEKPLGIAPRNMPQVLRTEASLPIKTGSGRRELANWIASSSNPLTARVWANRIWLHLFGSGIVRTPENFGASGQRPDHPELLDWLATELVAQGWSTKKLVREIVLSHVYRLSSTRSAEHAAVDPDDVTLWHMPERRLEAEAIRDAMLSVSGELQRVPPVGSTAGVIEGVLQREELLKYVTRERPVRSIYLPRLRDHLPEALEVFDAPDSSFVIGDREKTNVATQALYLMNDADVIHLADAFAERLLAREGHDDQRIGYAFQLVFGRAPTGSELASVRQFLSDYEKHVRKAGGSKNGGEERGTGKERRARSAAAGRDTPADAGPSVDPHRAAWSAFVQSLFQSAEFRLLG